MNIKQAILMEEMPDRSSFSAAGRQIFGWCMIALVAVLLSSCAHMQTQTMATSAADQDIGTVEVVTGEPREAVSLESAMSSSETGQVQSLPVRFQQPTYFINQMNGGGVDEDIVVPVGADISTTSGPVSLRDIIKKLASLKNMNVSWASDVNQYVMTDVDIRAGDDFFQAIDNLLRQVDYFHEVEGNTIVVKYKETKKFHIAMPPRLVSIASNNNTGSSTSSSLSANVDVNRWDNVRTNLDQILDIWSDIPGATTAAAAPAPSAEATETAAAPEATVNLANQRSGKGYYSINEDIGLVTVTGPRPLLEKISVYIESLKSELYRQISIEAKIVEVILDDTSTSGLNWNDLLNSFNIDVELFDGTTGVIYPNSNNWIINQVSIPSSFSLVLDAISEQGDTKVLANPKVSVMNGQPAVIYVGDNVTYIDKVTTTIDEGVATTSVTTAQATSGIRLEVYPTIINEEEIILSLTPLVSDLTRLGEATFNGNTVSLPEIRERTMNSIVRVKNGQMLIVGGLIDKSDGVEDTKVNLLGDLPIINKLFKSSKKTFSSKELVILLRPQII